MKKVAGFLGVALALGGIGTLAAGHGQRQAVALAAAAGQVAAGSPISKDSTGNADGDDPDAGTGVVDPVPQDDGTPGVDDGTGDGT